MDKKNKPKPKFTFINNNTNEELESMIYSIFLQNLIDKKYNFQQNDFKQH